MIAFALIATLAAAPAAPAVTDRTPVGVARRAGFNGLILVSKTDRIETRAAVGTQTPAGLRGPTAFRLDQPWRWASISKQVVATLVMQQVAEGRIILDRPIATYLPAFRGPNANRISVRQLLKHQSGLPNPDDTPDAGGMPIYYASANRAAIDPLTGYCAGPPKSEPTERWTYNNCDYIVAGALLEAVSGTSWQESIAQRVAKPLRMASLKTDRRRTETVSGYVDGKPEPNFAMTAFGASAGLSGNIDDLWRFDRGLMTGKLLAEPLRRELWDGQPASGSIALGQWAYSVKLPGCASPVRIVERRGAISGVELRNFILPDHDRIVIAFTNRSGFDFGELWQGKGFSHDLVAAAACT